MHRRRRHERRRVRQRRAALSRDPKLLAAFDHRHIFLDPDSRPGALSWDRAQAPVRPAALVLGRLRPRALISPGGGVFPRAMPRPSRSRPRCRPCWSVRRTEELSPADLVRAILKACRWSCSTSAASAPTSRLRGRSATRMWATRPTTRCASTRRELRVPGGGRGRQPGRSPKPDASPTPARVGASTPTPSTIRPGWTPPTTRSTSRSCWAAPSPSAPMC